MADLIFYSNPMSRGCTARWMLEEVGQPYDAVMLDYGGTMKDASYLAINPMGKVPALKHGDQIVTETAAVCAYLADAYPEAGLLPPIERRGAYYRWLFFAAGPIETAMQDGARKVENTPEQERMVGYGTRDRALGALADAVKPGPYICGDQFTAADVYVGSTLDWLTMFGMVDPAMFGDYLGRLRARPAYLRAKQLDEALRTPKAA